MLDVCDVAVTLAPTPVEGPRRARAGRGDRRADRPEIDRAPRTSRGTLRHQSSGRCPLWSRRIWVPRHGARPVGHRGRAGGALWAAPLRVPPAAARTVDVPVSNAVGRAPSAVPANRTCRIARARSRESRRATASGPGCASVSRLAGDILRLAQPHPDATLGRLCGPFVVGGARRRRPSSVICRPACWMPSLTATTPEEIRGPDWRSESSSRISAGQRHLLGGRSSRPGGAAPSS